MQQLRVIYDGDCPFCSRFVQLMRLRENFEVTLIDARIDAERARSYGKDLNQGMIVDLQGTVYYGADAVWLLSRLSSGSGLLNTAFARLFSTRCVARALYPAMRFGRFLTLKALRRRPL